MGVYHLLDVLIGRIDLSRIACFPPRRSECLVHHDEIDHLVGGAMTDAFIDILPALLLWP